MEQEKTKRGSRKKQRFKKLVEDILNMDVPKGYFEKRQEEAAKGDLAAQLTLEMSGRVTVKTLAAATLVAKFVKGDNSAANLVLSLTGEKPSEKGENGEREDIKVVIEDIKAG